MLLYKYKSLENLWHVLDIVINQRLYCAFWSELNDPLEGRYSIYFSDDDRSPEEKMRQIINKEKNKIRISSLSRNCNNFLLWSHYADGHRGVAIEIDFPDDFEHLHEITYIGFDSVFVDEIKPGEDMSHIFKSKTEEWHYEEEYRVLFEERFCLLPNPVKRIYLGPRVSKEQKDILEYIMPTSVELIETEIGYQESWAGKSGRVMLGENGVWPKAKRRSKKK